MIALKAEAQAFVDKYKLQNYKNDNLSVIITGMGSDAMFVATTNILKKFKENDIILNVGICGANQNYTIGQLIDSRYDEITCSKTEVSKTNFSIVDMESLGFKNATKGVKNSFIFKIVSDHFEPKKVTKDKAKQLIFNKIDEIMQRIENA
ncbi:MAG: hypothetical protein U9N02_00430 [Campylobacterota bacterium]|nr:hypothetical protein [Campylobacterota bacterium]